MQITLMQGILLAVVVFFCAVDKHLEVFLWFRPLVVAFFTGIILGDVKLGLAAGAIAELACMGLLTVGGTAPPDPLFTGLMTTVLAFTTGKDVNTALGLSIPFALIGQWIMMIIQTLYAGFLPAIDKACAEADDKKLGRIVISGALIQGICFAIAAFLATYAFQDGLAAFVNAFPEWLIHGFEVAGGLMPAVGLALLLVVMLKPDNVAYLFLGFVLIVITNCANILPVAIIAGVLAWIGFTRDKQIAKMTKGSVVEGGEDGI